MKPGLRMAMMAQSGGQNNRSEMRRIGFGENNEDYARRMPMPRPASGGDGGDDGEMRRNEMANRRQPRDDRGRYTTRRRSEYESNIIPYPMPYGPSGEGREEMRRNEMRRNEYREDNYDRRNEYNRRNEYDRGNGMERMRSHDGSKHEEQEIRAGGTFWMEPAGGMKKLTREKADKWVKHMESDNPKAPRGGVFTYEDAKKLAEDRDIPTEGQDLIDFYATLNMVYSDYSKVAKEYGVDNDDYYADLACAFLYDRDGKRPSEKLAAYYMYVVPKDGED